MRLRTGFLLLVPVALVAVLVGCNRPQLPPNAPGQQPGNGSAAEPPTTPDDEKADVGKWLFDPAKSLPPPPISAENSPILIPNCTVQYEDRQTISAEIDGKIELVAIKMTQLADGTWEYREPVDPADPAAAKVVKHDPANFDPNALHDRIDFLPRQKMGEGLKDNPMKWVPFYKLRDGDRVLAGQVICWLDSSSVEAKKTAAEAVRKAAGTVIESASAGLKLTQDKIDLYKGRTESVSKKEELDDQITKTRFAENLAQAAQAIARADGEVKEATELLRKHGVRCRVAGIIKNVAKRDGETVRPGEKILEVQSTDKVRLEGNLDIQYFGQVKRGTKVVVEPAVPSAPDLSHGWHRQPVAGVAVGGPAATPLVVSVGLDGAALVWEPNLGKKAGRPTRPHDLPHPVAVRAVACTPPGTKYTLAVTGADDGKVRIWDLANPDRLPAKPGRESAEAHTSGVTAVAVCPRGTYAATAAGREVFVWDLESGKKLYSLPESHRDGITSLAFTPQCELITASKDRTLKRWRLGTGKAAPAHTFDHRSGAVEFLGVSPDGGRVLFDQDKTRLDMVNIADGQTVGQLTTLGPSAAFATLALFGPDYLDPEKQRYTIVTAGGEGDLKGGLQVWHTPRSGGRAAEVARFFTPGRVPVSCAAFSPHPTAPFLVVGTSAGTVHLWPKPPAQRRDIPGTITHIDSTDPRYATVRVEVDNRVAGLLDRSSATVLVPAGQ